jgi:hypothetical protein
VSRSGAFQQDFLAQRQAVARAELDARGIRDPWPTQGPVARFADADTRRRMTGVRRAAAAARSANPEWQRRARNGAPS